MGDAVCTLNPLYGPGMTLCGLSALWLDACLRDQLKSEGGTDSLAKAFHAGLAKVIAEPWWFSTTLDSQMPTTEGPPLSFEARAALTLWGRLNRNAGKEPRLRTLSSEIGNMLKMPSAMLDPEVMKFIF